MSLVCPSILILVLTDLKLTILVNLFTMSNIKFLPFFFNLLISVSLSQNIWTSFLNNIWLLARIKNFCRAYNILFWKSSKYNSCSDRILYLDGVLLNSIFLQSTYRFFLISKYFARELLLWQIIHSEYNILKVYKNLLSCSTFSKLVCFLLTVYSKFL